MIFTHNLLLFPLIFMHDLLLFPLIFTHDLLLFPFDLYTQFDHFPFLWPWSYGSWIYNYLCNQCLSPLMLWVQISIRARCTTLCDKCLSVICNRLVIFPGYSRFPPPINWPPRYNWNVVESGVKHHQQTNNLLNFPLIFTHDL